MNATEKSDKFKSSSKNPRETLTIFINQNKTESNLHAERIVYDAALNLHAKVRATFGIRFGTGLFLALLILMKLEPPCLLSLPLLVLEIILDGVSPRMGLSTFPVYGTICGTLILVCLGLMQSGSQVVLLDIVLSFG